MDSVANDSKLKELTNLLTALQSFSIAYLQKKKMDEQHKTFLYQVINNIRELERILKNAKSGADINEQLSEYRKSVWTLIESNSNQPDELKLDDSLLSLLTSFYLQTITNTKVPPAAETKPEIKPPAQEQKKTPKVKVSKHEIADKIEEKIRLLEKSRIYIPPTKTANVVKLETKIDDVLQIAKKHGMSARAKNKYITEQAPEIDKIIQHLSANTELVLTSIQADEIRSMQTLLQELAEQYLLKDKKETEREQRYLTEIKKIRDNNTNKPEDQLFILQKTNELGKSFLHHAKFLEAQNTLQEGLTLLPPISKANNTQATISLLEVATRDLLGQSYLKQNKYNEAKISFQQAADLLKTLTTDTQYITILLGHARLAEEHEAEEILKQDKDIQHLKHMQTVLQKSGDVHLLHIVNKLLADLYEKMIDPKISFADKTKLVNDFMERWNKYTAERPEANTKAAWYTPEMEKIIEGDLTSNLRTIREMFAAQAAVQQAASPAAMIEAKEKAKTDAVQRSEAEIKASRDALLAKAEASRARAEAERIRLEKQAKEETAARLKAQQDALRSKQEADERARNEAAMLFRSKLREEELQNLRKSISRFMLEAKELLDKAHKNIGKHEYKTFLKDYEMKLRETIAQFNNIQPQERIDADLATLAKCLLRLGVALRNQGKFNDAEQYLQQAIHTFNALLNKQNYTNLSLAHLKIESSTELGRLYYMEKKYPQAQDAFNQVVKEVDYLVSRPGLDESLMSLFAELAKQNKAYALLMKKIDSAQTRVEHPEKPDNMIETLYHFPLLKRKVHEEEMQYVHHMLNVDKHLDDKSPHVLRLQEILLLLERSIFRKIIRLSQILIRENRNNNSLLDPLEKNLLKSYNEALINCGFVDVLKNAADTLPAEMMPFVAEIKLIRGELRSAKDLKLITLGLALEQKIIYLEYEKHLAELESRASAMTGVNAKAIQNIDNLLEAYRQELLTPLAPVDQAPVKNNKKWSIGGVISALKRKKKKSVNTKITPLGEAESK